MIEDSVHKVNRTISECSLNENEAWWMQCEPAIGEEPEGSTTHFRRIPVKAVSLLLLVVILGAQSTSAQETRTNPPTQISTRAEQEIIALSSEKWTWMSERDVDTLAALFHKKAIFVHMGGSWGKEQELTVIKSGGIWYKKADILEVSVNIIDNTAILLSRIVLLAVVGGNEVTNPFAVTEVYVKHSGSWQLCSLSFTKLLTPPGH
jgi:hypothetical protein